MKDNTAELFAEGFCCAQAVFVPFAVSMGMEREVALKLSEVFGGGIAGRGELCGALSGALLALSLKNGRISSDDFQAKADTRILGQKLLDTFAEEHGDVLCRALIGYDVSVPKEAAAAKESGVFKSLCPKLVESAAELTQKMLDEQ